MKRMPSRKHLLVVYQGHSGELGAMVDAVVDGATARANRGVDIRVMGALEAGVAEANWADGLLIGTPETFGSLGGAVKHFLETVYHSQLDHLRGRSYGLFVKADDDGAGAVMSAQRILTSLGWRVAARPVVARGPLTPPHLHACRQLGEVLAAGLSYAVA
jgi:NAD(P)H-dependent FMN reductase